MSDLEKQASTWVPPWQRPAASPTSESPPQGGQKDLREAAEQAAARWSAAPTADPAAADADASTAAEPADDVAPAEAEANDLVELTEAPDEDIDGCEVVTDDAPSGDTEDDAPTAQGEPDGRVPASRSGSDGGHAPEGGPVGSLGGAEGGSGAAGGPAGSLGGVEGDSAAAGGPAGSLGGAEGDSAAEGGPAAKKGRGKKAAADGASLKDGVAVAEMLAKALPEQRSKALKADSEAEAEEEPDEYEEPENYREFEPGEFKAALEAILMVVDEPVGELVLATVLEARAEDVANALIDLSASYTQEGRGFDLRRAAGGWRFYTRSDYASFVERFVLDGQQLRLTQASLETLAVVAYKQPVTRSRISAIRGVNVDGVIRTLITRGMVEECGTDPDSGGHLYRTTMLFLEKMGLDSVEQLPPLAPFLPDNLEELANGE